MVRTSESTQQRILEAAYGCFYREGFARVSVDAIAAAAGVTKRTLYYHFESKDALLAAVLAVQHQLALARIAQWGAGNEDDPAAMVQSIFTELRKWAERPGWLGSGFTRLAMELVGLPGHPARRAASQQKAVTEQWLARRFAAQRLPKSAALARQIMVLLEGAMTLMLIHRDPDYARAAAIAARTLIRQRSGSQSERSD